MVVDRQSVRGDFRPETIGIAVAQLVLVTDGADDDRLRPLDQPPHVETLVEIAFEVTERGMTSVAEPNDGKKARSAPDAGTARHRRDRSLRPRRIVG